MVAVSDHGNAMQLVGVCTFDGMHIFEEPTDAEFNMIFELDFDKQRFKGKGKYVPSEFEFPVGVHVSQSYLLDEELPMPKKNTFSAIVQRLDVAEIREVVARNDGIGDLEVSSDVLVCPCMSTTVKELIKKGQPFVWPMHRTMAAHAIRENFEEMPRQKYAFHKYGLPSGVSPDGEQSGDDDSDDELDPHGNRWQPGLLVQLATLQSLLKPCADLKEVVKLVARILGVSADGLTWPCHKTLRSALIKLDLGIMWWEQHLWLQGIHRSQAWYADSTDQTQIDYFCNRTQSLTCSASLSVTERLALDLPAAYGEKLNPLSCAAYGEGDLAHKVRLAIHAGQVEAGTGSTLYKWR